MSSNPRCPLDDLPAPDRRARLREPQGGAHAAGCLACSVFLALDTSLAISADRLPPPPARARWTYARARWAARNEASEQAAFYGDRVAKLLGIAGALVVLGLLVRALLTFESKGAMGLSLTVVGGTLVSIFFLVTVYRAWSES